MKHIQSDFVVNATDSKLAITTERMNELDRLRSDAVTIDRDS